MKYMQTLPLRLSGSLGVLGSTQMQNRVLHLDHQPSIAVRYVSNHTCECIIVCCCVLLCCCLLLLCCCCVVVCCCVLLCAVVCCCVLLCVVVCCMCIVVCAAMVLL